jgi:hypothetical protein
MNIQRLFDRYNQRFWKGELREWTVDEVHLSELPAGQHVEQGSTCADTREIFIQIGLAPAEKCKTLLHEMCHAAARDDMTHGPLWKKEMLRIGNLGGRGCAAEARRYERKRESGIF